MKSKTPAYIACLLLCCSIIFSGCTQSESIDYSNENINLYAYQTSPDDSFDEIKFMTVSDLHYFSPKLHDGGEAFAKAASSSNGQMLDLSSDILRQFINEVIKNAPDYLLVTGDLTFNGEKVSHEELKDLLQLIESHGVHVLVVPGNHDINNVYAREFSGDTQIKTDYVTYDEFSRIYAPFGPDLAVLKDSSSFSYVVEHEDTWFLMIDSNKYKNNIELGYPESGGEFSVEQTEWLDKVFEEAKKNNKEIIAAMHHNMVPHADVSPLFMADFLVAGATLGINEYFAKQDINLIFSGHIHCHDIAGVRYEDDFIYDVTTGALTVYPHNYRLCYLTSDGKIDIATGNIEDINSKTFDGKTFGQYSRDLAYQIKNFGTAEGVSKKDAQIMSRYATDIANAYFEGTDYEFSLNPENLKGYYLWENYPKNTPQKHFIIGMSKDTEPRDNEITIDLNTGFWD